ncbi:hypothetical protein CspeluHIS016_0300180 [Cutaneotrichosporon spelunceum]|uniref:Uncharacterized protein n=1 Tax=Cutaneotrichosporon spelunceum TaxID=1672016 RepID=A0AAD3TT53_9TREE|nr:hypothetical protein CspeluHIS016_0300180 [Cutaneotrichosporon spelunceum]
MPFHNRRRHLEERDMADALNTLPPLAPTLSIGIQEPATPATLPRVTRQRAVTMMNAVGRLATAVKNNNTRALPTTPTGITENASAWLSRPSGSSNTSAIRSTTAGWSADLFAPGPLPASPLAPGPSCSATTATTFAACTPAIPTVLDTTHTTPANNSPPHTSNTTDDAPTDDNDNTHTTPIQGPTLTPESDATLASHAISPTLSATSAISDTSGSPDPLASSSPPVVLYDTNGLPIQPQPYFNDVTWEVEDYHPIFFTLPPPAIASPIAATTTTPTIATAATSSATVTALTAVPPLAIATTTGAITGVSTVAATSTAPAAQTPLAITDTTTTASTSAAGSSTLGRDRRLPSPITVPRLPFVDKSDFHSNPVPDQPTDNETPLASPASPASPRVVNLTVYQVEPRAPSTPDRE